MNRILLFLLSCYAGFATADDGGQYSISAGDLISIIVFGEDDLSLERVRVAGDGTISFPLLGEVMVRGRTARQLEFDLTVRLADGYLRKPEVNVSVVEYRLFYVNGEVENPGGYPYRDGLTVQKAVALAGGFTERASKSKITLVRESASDATGEAASLGTRVSPGDVITVGESFF
ncbi:MAG: polysaccharide export protein [Chromatiales bacterium]|nr:polysaccharide export protein [Chromatiales bacterium]